MTKLIPYADVVEEHLSIDKEKSVVHVDTPMQNQEDVNNIPIYVLDDGWCVKVRARKGEGSGQMKFKKDVPRRFRNHFREANNFKKAMPERIVDKTKVRAKIPRRKLK
jgi:hypothetical protein